MRVLVFGASVTYGQGGIGGSWVEKIRVAYDAQPKKNITVVNLGIPGNTSQDVLDRFDNETAARNNFGEIGFVFLVGANDSKMRDGKEVTTPNQYLENLETLIEKARSYSERILFVELTPCVPGRITSASVFTNERIVKYNKIINEVCSKNNIPTVPLFNDFTEFLKTNDCLPDGLHPNNDGYEFMASKIKPMFDEVMAK